MAQYTSWFSGKTRPSRIGLYQVVYRIKKTNKFYLHFDGYNWIDPKGEKIVAARADFFKWRGLLSPQVS